MLNTNITKLVCGLATATLLIQSSTASAQSFQALNLTPYGNYSLGESGAATGFPLGSPTYLGHVPFLQNGGANEVWNGYYAGGEEGFATLTIPVNIPNAYGFYTLLNTWWGQDAEVGTFATVIFSFSDSSSLSFNLYGNQDLRDFNNPGSGFTTTINGTTAQNVYQNPVGTYVIDRQWFDFGIEAGKTLTAFTLIDSGSGSFQNSLLSGATVQTDVGGQVSGPALLPGESWTPEPVPEPSTLALAAFGGLGWLMIFRRRK
jgi:hypothetical protein